MNVVSGRDANDAFEGREVGPERAGVVHVDEDGPAELAAETVYVHVAGMVDGQADLVLAKALHDAGVSQGVKAFNVASGLMRVDVAEGDGLVRAGLVRFQCDLRGHRVTVPGGRARSRFERQQHRDAPAVSVDVSSDGVDSAAIADVGVEVDHAPASASLWACVATLSKALAYWSMRSSAGRVKLGSSIVS